MIPATRPATSESWPSWAEIELTCCWVNDSGSAPNFSTFASWFAWSWLKPAGCGPVISIWPAVIGWLVSGADCTSPSRTTAVWLSTASFWLPLW